MSKSCKIILSDGAFALVSEIDADLSRLKWCRCSRNRMANGERRDGYAMRHLKTVKRKGKRRQIFLSLHTEVAERMGIKGSPDHINGQTLDCRRENLRESTHAENMRNRTGWSKSGLKGVYSRKDKYEAYILHKYIGTFRTKEEAGRAYDVEALRLFGEFSRLNFPKQSQTRAA